VAKVHEVCSLNLYAKYFKKFVLSPMCGFKVYPSIWWVLLECTHPFGGFYWSAPIYLEGCIGNLKGEKINKRDVWMGGGGEGGLWHKSYLCIKKC